MRRERYRTHLRSAFLTAICAVGVLFVLPAAADAAAVNVGLTPQVEGAIGLGTADIRVIVARIIRNLFGLLGVIAVVIILYGGFLWMTSRGEEETVNKAKRVILNGVIGLAIILSALAITQFILNSLLEATGVLMPGGGGAGAQAVPRSGSLGAGIIESHYPERGATGIARNTKIVVTFKEEMDPASLMGDWTPNDPDPCGKHELNAANVRIYVKAEGIDKALAPAAVEAYCTSDRKSWVFRPVGLLGNPVENVPYIVDLAGGETGIRKIQAGKSVPAFDGVFSGGYEWDFTTGTFIDTTPPRVETVYPRIGSGNNPRNTVIQVNFSEAVDPTTVSGKLPGFKNLGVGAGTPPAEVAGEFAVGNRYRTVEFRSADLCGKNACGGDVFCLPGAATIAAFVRAATLGPEPPESILPPDGVVDMAGNSLDGDRDGVAEGPDDGATVKDDFRWTFSTNDVIDLVPPRLEKTEPGKDAEQVPQDKPLEGTFSKVMSFLTFSTAAVGLQAVTLSGGEPTCFSTAGEHVYPLDAQGNPDLTAEPEKSVLRINHCLFLPETNYVPDVTSLVTDIRQNCYYPGVNDSVGTCSATAMVGFSYCCNGTPCVSKCVVTPPGTVPICPP